jgi:hypothetical protein
MTAAKIISGLRCLGDLGGQRASEALDCSGRVRPLTTKVAVSLDFESTVTFAL